VFRECYSTSETIAGAWTGAIAQSPWRAVVGYLDGEPVATNMLVCGAGVAGLYAVGTVPAARGKGIGAATTLHLLLVARALGYRYGVLFASPLGVPVYQRVGFRLMNSSLRRFLWQQP
jgi:GNAT superfamily N-acetyltransferase